MTSTGSYEDLFKKEIAKYDHICEEISQNIQAQQQLLMQIQDAITNVKQQCSDFVMTRNIQCREMIDDVQRQVSGLSFQDRSSSNQNYPSVPPRTMSPQQADTGNFSQNSRPQAPASYYQSSPQHTESTNVSQVSRPQAPAPYYQPPQNHLSMSGYGPPYGSSQGPSQQPHQPPYNAPPSSGSPYPPQQPHQQPPASYEYGQPAYPGWRGPYYNAHSQQPPSSFPRPPYTVPGSHPHQSGYYRPQ
ncbi:Vacuolar-sorting protein BRO1 [Bienertia sinuspersici]